MNDLFHEELARMRSQADALVRSTVTGLSPVMAGALMSGGKNLRGLLLIIFSRRQSMVHSEAPFYAAGIELLHLASLVHDDIIDNAQLRRQRPAMHRAQGRKMAVLAGDFICMRVLSGINGRAVPAIASDFFTMTSAMVEGEIDQLLNGSRPQCTEEEYLLVAGKKTGSLFSLATTTGARLSGSPEKGVACALECGQVFGTAFQILDDILDLTASVDRTGKEPHQDIYNGLMTIPVIHHLRAGGSLKELQLLAESGAHTGIVAALISTGSIEYACELARELMKKSCEKAGEALPVFEAGLVSSLCSELMEKTHEGVIYGT